MTNKRRPKVLAVDDETFNLDIITDYLKEANFDVITAGDGDVVMQLLEEHAPIDVIVLDRQMPKVNGMEVVRSIKKDDRFKNIPIVMQTVLSQTEQVTEGLDAGVYYYLAKPYKGPLFISIVNAALNDGSRLQEIENEINQCTYVPHLIEEATFEFRTFAEVKSLAYFLASPFPNPQKTAFGLSEFMMNAIEHGNLGITYAEKNKCVLAGTLSQEIEKRASLPENKGKRASIKIESTNHFLRATITDQGSGFNFKDYLELAPERATDPNGRGIVQGKACFTSIEYLGTGNTVVCTAQLNQKANSEDSTAA